jgi:hypothetical protein
MIGTDLFRKQFHPDIWVHIVEKKILDELSINPDSKIIISDCRFPNEIAMIKKLVTKIKKLGAKLLHIQRNKPEWFDKYKSGIDCEEALKLHVSETSWIREEFDYTINNSSNKTIIFEKEIEKFVEDNFGLSKNISI